MEDRLAELIRQRALIAEHLQWLDREIARASAASPLSSQPLVSAAEITPALPTAAEVLKSLPPHAVTEPATTAALPVAATTVSLLTSVGTANPAPAESPAAVIGDTRVRDIREQARSGCLLWVTVGVVVFLATVTAMIFFGRLMRPDPKDSRERESPEKTGRLVFPLVQHDARA